MDRPPLLEATHLEAFYGPVKVLHGVSFRVDVGGVLSILGANGAGKSTTLRALSGLIQTRGSIRFAGEEIRGRSVESIARMGIVHVPEGRVLFREMSVEENLQAGAYTIGDKGVVKAAFDRVYSLFPRLRDRRRQPAGSLSGGEQQMLAIGRGLMMQPRLLLVDEPSLGLAPLVTRQIFDILRTINTVEGVSIVLVEQNVSLALEIANVGHVLEAGRIVLSGRAEELKGDVKFRQAYLGY